MQGEFKLLRIERTGAAQMRGVTVNSGDNITDVRLVAAYADAIVIGQVQMKNGTLPPGSRVFARLSPVGQGQGGGRGAPNQGMANVDERGRFLIQNIPAGNYNLIVTATVPGQGRGRGQVSAQQAVTAIEGQVANVTVALDLGQNPPKP